MHRTIRRACAVLLAATAMWAICAQTAAAQSDPAQGPGGPVLVLTDAGFGRYYPEILRAEGLNEFAVANVSAMSPTLLNAYQVVIVADAPISAAQAGMLNGWVASGGNLIAMRPDDTLAPLLGLGGDGGDVDNGYMAINTSTAPGAGITGGTMQFHGTADRRTLAGAQQVAALYDGGATSTGTPAVTLRSVGTGGGQAAAFTYDLARSVVLTRQGNPDQAGEDFEGGGPIRSNDLFQPDWLDISKVAIPQADEQQRLLANLITQMNMDRAPLPRFWYLPRGEQAAVVMTGDDHGTGGTTKRFNDFLAASPAGCSVANWGCTRGTSYVFTNTFQLDNSAANNFEAQGFEIALHVDTGCANQAVDTLSGTWAGQLNAFRNFYSSINPPRTGRTHCVPWGDWAGAAVAEHNNGIRFDTNYYYYPGSWARDNPGVFTGSGFPMRFAASDGELIDVYQAATQITDEWEDNQASIPTHIAALLNRAVGSQGYYGVFTVNMHTDKVDETAPGSPAIVNAAKARGVPVVSAAQMLDWLDGRNSAAFRSVSYSAGQLQFTVTRDPRANGLQGMVPARSASGALSSLTRNGVPVSAPIRRLKGIDYAVFDATAANYVATYTGGVPETTITQAAVSGNVARFVFTGSGAAAFQCRMDGAAFTACASPKSFGNVSRGGHTFEVRAVSAVGVADPTPAQRSFVVGKTASASGKSNRGRKVKLTPKRVRVAADGKVRLRVRCPLAEDRCRVQLKLKLDGKTVASRKLKVSGGKSRSIRLTLRRSARLRLFEKGSLRVKATAVSRDSGGGRAVTRKTIRLVAP